MVSAFVADVAGANFALCSLQLAQMCRAALQEGAINLAPKLKLNPSKAAVYTQKRQVCSPKGILWYFAH
jgi:hypothetical protein